MPLPLLGRLYWALPASLAPSFNTLGLLSLAAFTLDGLLATICVQQGLWQYNRQAVVAGRQADTNYMVRMIHVLETNCSPGPLGSDTQTGCSGVKSFNPSLQHQQHPCPWTAGWHAGWQAHLKLSGHSSRQG
jgi:hypothetical protein